MPVDGRLFDNMPGQHASEDAIRKYVVVAGQELQLFYKEIYNWNYAIFPYINLYG